jgi:hypothetical protein
MSADSNDLNSFKIHLWDTFNTLDSDDYTCESLQKNGKICGKKCSLKYKDENNKMMIYTCKTHFPKEITIKKENAFKKKNIDDYLLQDIANIVLLRVQEIFDTNNEIFKSITSIVIELQPKINQKMKFTSHIIYGKLVELYRDTKCTIRFVRAAQKLKAYTGPDIKCTLKGKYAQRKWLSIQYTKWFLENKFSKEEKDKWLIFLESHKKRDDMCDTFLMTINALVGIPKKQMTNKKGKCIK